MVDEIAVACRAIERGLAVPVLAQAHGFAAAATGSSMSEAFTDPAASLEQQLRARRELGYGDPPSFLWADFGAFEFGGKNRWPARYEDLSPSADHRPVTCSREVYALAWPTVRFAGSVPPLLAFCRLAVDRGLSAVVRAGTPTLVAASITGLPLLGRLMKQDRDAAHCLLAKATGFLMALLDAVIDDVGAEHVWPYVGAACDSAAVADKALVEEFGAVYQAQLNRHLLHRGVRSAYVHLCGEHGDRMDVWSELNWPERCLFSLSSSADILDCAARLGPQHAVAGAVSTTLLAHGTPQRVYEESRRYVQLGKLLPGRFVLAPECDMPVLAPLANVTAFVEAAQAP